jgi:hypothetical protein
MNKMDLNMTPHSGSDDDVVTPRASFLDGKAHGCLRRSASCHRWRWRGCCCADDAHRAKPEEKGDAPHRTGVQFAVAHARPTTISIGVQGEVRPRTEATLAAQVSGRLVWVSPAFVDGGSFREGDVLARVDGANYRARCRARACASRASAKKRWCARKPKANSRAKIGKRLAVAKRRRSLCANRKWRKRARARCFASCVAFG